MSSYIGLRRGRNLCRENHPAESKGGVQEVTMDTTQIIIAVIVIVVVGGLLAFWFNRRRPT